MLKNIDIDLELQPYLDRPPITPQQMYKNACSSDEVTIDSFRGKWVDNYRINHEKFGPFGEKTVGKLHGINRHKPCIVLGAGPSLKENLEGLRMNQESKNPVMVVSCLHNFGYLMDEGIKVDYWVTLDSNNIVLDTITEGRQKDEYWEETKDQVLLAYTASPTLLLEKWQGKIQFFNTNIPDAEIQRQQREIEVFTHFISSGANVLGACMYIAKMVFGSSTIVYVGADFCFSYDNTFYSYKTDKPIGGYMLWPDIFGIPRKTWPSYMNFKYWFDRCACEVPGHWVSCSFGLLGSYQGGVLRQFEYWQLDQYLERYFMADRVSFMIHGLDKKDVVELDEFYKDPANDKNMAFM